MLDANPELVMSTLETDWKLGSEAVDGVWAKLPTETSHNSLNSQ